MSEFKHSINIPVPIGESVWTFWTDCCMACYFQPRDIKCINCNTTSPCHTFITSVQAVELKYSNLEDVLAQWGKKYFYTEQEARDMAELIRTTHIAHMRELGYKVNDDGHAEKEDGWEAALCEEE